MVSMCGFLVLRLYSFSLEVLSLCLFLLVFIPPVLKEPVCSKAALIIAKADAKLRASGERGKSGDFHVNLKQH